MIFAKCCWTTKGLSAAGMSTLLERNFPRVATKSYLVLIEFIFTIIRDKLITTISNSITTIDKLKIEESEICAPLPHQLRHSNLRRIASFT